LSEYFFLFLASAGVSAKVMMPVAVTAQPFPVFLMSEKRGKRSIPYTSSTAKTQELVRCWKELSGHGMWGF